MSRAHEDSQSSARLLEKVQSPQDLHGMSEEELQSLAQEVREHIIDTVGEIGGHFGANLGTCELAGGAALAGLDSPRDKILWDVGHQAYPHKVLTGRRDQLHTIRQYGGLAPFLLQRGVLRIDIIGAGQRLLTFERRGTRRVGIKEGMRHLGAGEQGGGGAACVIGDGADDGRGSRSRRSARRAVWGPRSWWC